MSALIRTCYTCSCLSSCHDFLSLHPIESLPTLCFDHFSCELDNFVVLDRVKGLHRGCVGGLNAVDENVDHVIGYRRDGSKAVPLVQFSSAGMFINRSKYVRKDCFSPSFNNVSSSDTDIPNDKLHTTHGP